MRLLSVQSGGMNVKDVVVQNITIGKKEPLVFFSGPCVIESLDHTLTCAQVLKKIAEKTNSRLIFKASYDKANRTSFDSYRGPGIEEGLKILERVKKEFDLPVVSDVHTVEEVKAAKEVLDVLQIPAFLCRQTDLIVEAAKTQMPIQIKKGQFMSPWAMKNIVNKITHFGNEKLLLCDRGVSFGYNTLVSDMCAIPIMQECGFPVVFDATHSVQMPPTSAKTTGGNRQFIPTLAKAAVAAGCQAVFIECHPDPQNALSDSGTVFPLDQMEKLMHVLNEYSILSRKMDEEYLISL